MTLDLSFKDLADVAEKGSSGAGCPLLIAIDLIAEDPDQPRRVFREQELDELSASIREHGVLQPIVVRRSSEEGQYVIVMGARRHRAALRAGLQEIPILIQDNDQRDRYAQMIENIQRDDLRAPEIAAFVAGRLDAGDTQSDISRKLGKPRDWVSRFASVQSMPEFLRAKLESSSIRALYELYQAWRAHPAAIERLCAARASFTDAQARELVRKFRADLDRTDTQIESSAGSVSSKTSDVATRASVSRAASEGADAPTEKQPTRTHAASPSRSACLTILVRHQQRVGRLLIDRSASQGSRHGVVVFDGSHEAEEVAASALTIEEILSP